MMSNRYPGTCQTCRCSVKPNAGFVRKEAGCWLTYCRQHAPERIEAAPVASTRRELTAEGQVYTPYEPANLPILRAMPGARWNAHSKCWQVSLAEADRPRLLELANKLGLTVPDSLRAVRVTEQATAAETAGLFPFQVAGVQWLSLRDKALLGDDMGLGKTVQALRAIPAGGRTLVVCPACVKFNWAAECKRWRPDLSPVVLSGKTAFRWPAASEVVIINYDVLPERFAPAKKGEPLVLATGDRECAAQTILIADEGHKAKSWKAKRSQRCKTLSTLCRKVWVLTGTPLLNRPSDLFGVLDSFGMASEVFGSFSRFMRLYNAEKDRWGGIRWGRPAPEVPELLRRVMIRRIRTEVLPDLPRKTYSTITVNCLPASLRKKLDAAWEEWQDALECTSELPPFEQFSSIRAELAAARIDAVTEYVEDCEEQDVPLLVFSAHRAPIDALESREGWATITGDTSPAKRQEIVESFQAGQLRGVGLTIQAGGVGLTLTRAWKALFVDLDWTPANNWQAEDRICRIGQTAQAVEIVRMVSDHALDQHVCKLIAKKIDMIQRSVEDTVQAVIPEPPAVQGESETEEQFQARITRIAAERAERAAKEEADRKQVEKDAAKARVAGIHARQTARVTRELLPLTEERADAVRRAFDHMLGVCDGALARDGQGFNKPDAFVAHCLLTAGLETRTELEAGYAMLSRYHRQLSGQFPVLFQG